MAAASESTRRVFQHYVDEHGNAGPIGRIAAHLAAGTLDRASADEIVGARPPAWLKPALLDLLLFYVEQVLGDEPLAADERITLGELKLLLRITEGDFARHRPAEVAAILSDQLDRMLHDDFIDDAEALQQVELQRAFDLSYDEYLAFTRSAVEAAVERLIREVETPKSDEQERLAYAKLEAIETVYLLSASQRRRIRGR